MVRSEPAVRWHVLSLSRLRPFEVNVPLPVQLLPPPSGLAMIVDSSVILSVVLPKNI